MPKKMLGLLTVTVLFLAILCSVSLVFAGGNHNPFFITSNVDFFMPAFINASQVSWSYVCQTPFYASLASNSVNSFTVLNTTMDFSGVTYTFQYWNITTGSADTNGLLIDDHTTISFNTGGSIVSFAITLAYSPEVPAPQVYTMTPDFMNGNMTHAIGETGLSAPWAATIDFSQEVNQDNLTVILADFGQTHNITVSLNPDSTFFVHYNNNTSNLIASGNSWTYIVRLSLYQNTLTVSWLDDQLTYQFYTVQAPVANFDLWRLSVETSYGTVSSNVNVAYGALTTPEPTPTPTPNSGGVGGGGNWIEPSASPSPEPTVTTPHEIAPIISRQNLFLIVLVIGVVALGYFLFRKK